MTGAVTALSASTQAAESVTRFTPGLAGQLAKLPDRIELRVIPVAVLVHPARGAEREAGALGGRLSPGMPARQQAPGDRVVARTSW
jgi:hypothetical protein